MLVVLIGTVIIFPTVARLAVVEAGRAARLGNLAEVRTATLREVWGIGVDAEVRDVVRRARMVVSIEVRILAERGGGRTYLRLNCWMRFEL